MFVGFAPAENPEIAIAIILENGRGGSAATALARPILDYWLLNKNKKPIRPSAAQVSGGLMTAGLKPSELPSGEVPSSTAPNTNSSNNPNIAPHNPTPNLNHAQTAPSSTTTHSPACTLNDFIHHWNKRLTAFHTKTLSTYEFCT